MEKKITAVIICGLSCVCMLITIVYCIDLQNQYKTDKNYAILCENQVDYYEMNNEEFVKGTFFIEDNQIAEASNIHKYVDITLITLDFSLNELFGVGAELLENDMQGCIVSSKLAEELFGDKDIVGLDIIIKNQSYYIRSVFESKEMVMLIQYENNTQGAWAQTESREVSGVVINVEDELYRGQYIEELCRHHNLGGSNYYYVSDYLDVFPKLQLPAKWSDFNIWSKWSEEIKDISNRRVYHNKDVIETFYYRIYNRLQDYRMTSLFLGIIFVISGIKSILIYKNEN